MLFTDYNVTSQASGSQPFCLSTLLVDFPNLTPLLSLTSFTIFRANLKEKSAFFNLHLRFEQNPKLVSTLFSF